MSGQKTIVHLVHGTWPYGFGREEPQPDDEPAWFMRASRFRLEVERRLGRPVEFVAFKWSGKNGFAWRQQAALELHDHLCECMNRNSDAAHLLIAHSHGGTVAVAAVGNAERPLPGRLAGLLTMGTPFVSLREVPDTGPMMAVRWVVMRAFWPI